MDALLVSMGLVALAEMGDKTQLLALLLAARFRQPVAILTGIAVATILNHALAGIVGQWLTSNIESHWLQWGLGISFVLMAGWTLKADSLNDNQRGRLWGLNAFWATTLLFFLAEMGDKTQLATVGLAAHYSSVWLVVIGTTLGLLIANAPVIWFGDRLLSRWPLGRLRWVAAILFLAFGLWILIDSMG